MKNILVAAVALFVSTGLQAGNKYYVDANNGNDAWDGSAAEHEENTDVGPKRTLAAACALLESGKSDILYAAPGDYNEGVVTNKTVNYKGVYGACLFRVELPPTSSLVASGRKEETFIYGAAATINPDSYGRGTNALRCVYANNALVKGFTILNGRSLYDNAKPHDDNGCRGGGVIGGGFIVDCVVSNCCAGRGGGMFSAKAIRTVFGTNSATEGTDISYCTAYNCLFKNAGGASNSSCYNCTARSTIGVNSKFWNCVSLYSKGNGNTLHTSVYVNDSGTTVNILDGSHQATAAEINLDENNVPHLPSVLVNVGSNEVYNANWPTDPLVAEFKDQDLHGNPRVVDGQIDIGACESPSGVYVLDAPGGLTVTGAAVGYNDVPEEGLNVSISRNYSTTPIVVGIRIGDEYVDFNAHEDGWTWTKTFTKDDGTVIVEAVYADKTEWYVDADRGDDGNDGKRPGEAHARQTLAGIMKLASSGDIIHAARGTYDKGEMYLANYYSNRVVVTSGVVLVADDGPDVTFIKGKISTAEGNVNGCAIDSMRCVFANANSVVKGFTLVDGRSYYPTAGSNNGNGGGANGSGLFVDCCFSNNVARNRGDAASAATLLRCRIANEGDYPLYSSVRMINCIYDCPGTFYSYVHAYNTTFLRGAVMGGGGAKPDSDVWNCVFLGGTTVNTMIISNCYSTGYSGTGTIFDDRSRFNIPAESLAIDTKTKRPEAGSLAIDNALAMHYARATNGWNKTWLSFAKEDFAGGQRIYNGAIDVGAGEYDWRGDYAKLMRKDQKRDFAVVEAGEAVSTNALGLVSLADGCTVTAEWTLPKDDDCWFSATITGGGSLTALLDGEPLAPGLDGTYRFSALEGNHTLVFSYSGEGEAALHDFARTGYGLMLMLK